jgi:hypothetical protein
MMRKHATKKRPFRQEVIPRFLSGAKCFSPDFGNFTVKKAWNVSTYTANFIPPENLWIKMKIRTRYGDLIVMSHDIGKFEILPNRKAVKK